MKLNRRSFLKVAGASAAAAMTVAATSAMADDAAATYVPGTYTGSSKGISSDVTVTITVDETSVTDVTVDSSGETATIGAAAQDELQQQLLAAGSSDIDGVSGATVTSQAAEKAMDAALAAAKAGDQAAADEQAAADAEASLDTDWKTAPEEVTDFAAEYTTDVVVVGHGYAGVTATRELAEQGHAVTLIEAQAEDSWQALGNEFACINGDAVIDYGADHIDPVEFFNNFMKITGNVPNPTLVMKFAQNSAENSNWYLDHCTEEDMATMTSNFLPKTEHQLDELNGIKFWASVCSFYGDCNETKLQTYNREAAIEAGAQVMFGTAGYYVIMDDGKVAGLVAKNDDGYIKFNCKAVVIACGGFGGNQAMMNDLIPDMANACVEGEQLSSMAARDGSGVKMAYWAGAHLETTPVPGMNMKGLAVPGKMNVLPQAVWVDENGKRFCNEFWPTAEQRGYQNIFQTRKTKFAICDDNFTEYRQYTLPQHAGFNATDENIQSLRDALDEAYAKFNGTYEEPEQTEQDGAGAGPMTTAEYIADDTLEGLADQLGFEGDAKDAFLAQIEEYNQYCEDGSDQQFGRDPQVLFPVKQAPFYAVKFEPELGETMVTMGGILTDGEQNAIDKDYEPIPGLYVSGNDCGRRFGYEYVTPIPGCSLGMAITLGRECGKSVCKFLDAQA